LGKGVRGQRKGFFKTVRYLQNASLAWYLANTYLP
jgi:hypothetical protein